MGQLTTRGLFAIGVVVLVGCGGAQTPAAEPDPAPAPAPAPEPAPAPTPEPGLEATPEPGYATLPLPNSDNLVPALKHGAESSGCQLTAEEGQRIAATCEEDTVFLEQVGAELRYSCQTLDDAGCKTLLGKIVAAAGKT